MTQMFIKGKLLVILDMSEPGFINSETLKLWQRADCYRRIGNYRAALEPLHQALELEPDNLILELSIAESFHFSGLKGDSLKSYRKLHFSYPEELHFIRMVARLFEDIHDYKEAGRILVKAPLSELEPSNPEAQEIVILWAEYLLRNSNFIQAEDFLAKYEVQMGGHKELYRLLAKIFIGLKDYEKALHHLQQLATIDSEDDEAKLVTAWVNFKMGKSSDAMDICDQIISRKEFTLNTAAAIFLKFTQSLNDNVETAEAEDPTIEEILAKQPRAYLDLADHFLRFYLLDFALIALKYHDRHNPDDPESSLMKAQVSESLGDVDQTILFYQEAYRLAPSMQRILEMLVHLYQGHGKYDEALRTVNEILSNIPPDYKSGYEIKRGELLYRMGEFMDSYEALIEYYSTDNDQYGVLFFLGATSLRIGKIEEAETYLKQAYSHWPLDEELQMDLIDTLHHLGKEEEIIRLTEQILENQPYNSFAICHQGISLLYLSNGQDARGLELINKAIDMDPHIAEYYFHLGMIHYRTGEVEKAETIFDQGLKINPSHSDLVFSKGMIQFEQGNWERALPFFTKTLEINNGQVMAWANRGKCLMEMGKYDEALKSVNTALEMHPRFFDHWMTKLEIYMVQEKFPDALETANELTGRFPEIADGFYATSIIQGRLENYNEAMVSLDKCIELDPQEPNYQVQKGHLLITMGEEQKSRDYYHRIKIKFPESGALTSLEERLSQLGVRNL